MINHTTPRCHPRKNKTNPWRILTPIAVASVSFLLSCLASATLAAPLSENPPPTPTPTLLPGPYDCKTGADYTNFTADSPLVTQVCPANDNNLYKDGMQSGGPDYIVIHNTGNNDATAIQGNINWFQDAARNVSAHYIVGLDSDGNVHVIQMVKEADMAYHAGSVTRLEGNLIDNSNSIGIEVVGIGTLAGWPSDNVLAVVANLVEDIARRHGITLDRVQIVGHEEISIDSKPDPGPNWDWLRFIETEAAGEYKPAAQLSAIRDAQNNRVSLTLTARHNTRTGFRVEASEDEAPFQVVQAIGVVANRPNYQLDNPRTFLLTSYTPEATVRPLEICYRTVTVRDTYDYVNPSPPGCIIHGLVGTDYEGVPRRDAALISQQAYPIAQPNELVKLTFTLRNTGILSWKPDGRYVLINTGGESFNLPTRINVIRQTYTNEEVTFELEISAPDGPGAYTTMWQMAYIDLETGKIVLFGDEAGGIVTVLPEGASADLKQIIQTILDNAVQAANQSLDEFLNSIQERIQTEIEKAICETSQIIPCLAPLFCMAGFIGVSTGFKKRRAEYDDRS